MPESDCEHDSCGFDSWELTVFIFALWEQAKAWRSDKPLNTQCFYNIAESRELDSLILVLSSITFYDLYILFLFFKFTPYPAPMSIVSIDGEISAKTPLLCFIFFFTLLLE